MAAMRPLTADDFPEVYATFLAGDDASAGPDDWRRMLEVSLQYGDCCGQGLFDAGRLVGMVGMLFSQRIIDGRTHRFCNLHTWNVHEPYRGHSLGLLRPALALKDHTLTDFTPTPAVAEINRRLGLRPLDSRLMILSPGRASAVESEVVFSANIADIQQRIGDTQAALVRDHPVPEFFHLVAEFRGDWCYLVAARVIRYLVPYCHVYHVSNPGLFREVHRPICRRLKDLTCTRFVGVDVRRFGKRLSGAVIVPAPSG